MKKIKRMMAIAIAIMLAVTTVGAFTAFAGTIEVKNVVDNEEYSAYKILNYTKSGTAYSYYLTSAEYTSIGSVLEAAGFTFTSSSDGSQYFVSNAEALSTSGVSDVAAYLASHLSDLGNGLGKYDATGANGSATFSNLPTGYFFVTSTTGSLCALHSDVDIATAVEKNTVPSVDKKESTTESNYVDGPIDENIGDTVYYQIVVTDGVGTDAELTLKDTMTAGLDYKAGTLKINGTAVADNANTTDWAVTVSGRVITIVFTPAYVASLDANATITVTYQATINENAVINSATGNENKVELDYSQQHSEDKVYVETYDFQVFKTDGTNFLDGAEFKLYDALTGGNQILLSSDSTGYYKDANGSADTTIDINAATGCNVRGLAPGKYYLEEVVVPAGYNKLAARQEVEVIRGATAAVQITVVNNAGAQLPSTGGSGTTMIYIIGVILLAGAGILLVTRRRMKAE